MLKLKCFYNCRCCAAKYDNTIETEEQFQTILNHLGGYNFMYHPHKCDEDKEDLDSRVGIADLIHFEIMKE